MIGGAKARGESGTPRGVAVWVLLCALWLLTSYCARRDSVAPAKRRPGAKQEKVARSLLDAGAARGAGESGTRERDSVRSVGPTPGRVRCGEQICQVGSTHCCRLGSTDREPQAQYCEPNELRAPPGCEEPSCKGYCIQSDFEEYVAAECDDSADCPGGMCCVTYPWSADIAFLTCVKTEQADKNVCETGEACVEGGECRTGRTSCQDGLCKVSAPSVQCGEVRCTGDSPICCAKQDGTAAECVADVDACGRRHGEMPFALGCLSPADCGKGQSCCYFMGRSECRGICRMGNELDLCAADDDCPSGFECRVARDIFSDLEKKSQLDLATCCKRSNPKECTFF